ncbi:fumarylacetoacetate hydrolase family protein [Rugosimonospora acidiphila]|uniref:Fumarylacetoacetate hydrolase family protein n=1 Tax=Rugosimonospora acidiphila TaxID=556531 RepID=A0ABP9S3F2_9ACTN
MSIQIVRYASAGDVGIGLRDGDTATVRALAAPSLAALLREGRAALREAVESPGEVVPDARLLPPVDGLTEVWAAGVTYLRSSQARQEESQVADVYSRVYDASRPELFFKSPAWRVCGDGEPIGVRVDSDIDVPEPELGLVCDARGDLIGLTVCDDVSSRSIEGENPLYLPQAKIYSGSCALGPGIVPIWQLPDPAALDIAVTVLRDGAPAWSGRTSTARMRRGFDELIEYLFRQATFPDGVILSTGTGLVPDLDFSLAPDDEVVIEIEGVGRLANPVRRATDEAFAWLTPAPDRRPA